MRQEMELHVKRFSELTTEELYRLLRLRVTAIRMHFMSGLKIRMASGRICGFWMRARSANM